MKNELRDELLIAELFDLQPESVVWFQPVFSSSTQHNDEVLIDFEVRYCNNSASEFLNASKEEVLNARLLTNNILDNDSSQLIFEQCSKVFETGVAYDFTYFNTHLGRYYNVLRSKVKDGVLSITRDRTEQHLMENKLKGQAQKYNTVIDTSGDGILVLESVRNKNNEIVDFKIAHCNQVACHLGRLPSVPSNQNLLDVLPHLKSSGQFLLHKKVVDTGIPEKFETTFRTETGEEYGWFIVTLMKLDDGVLSRFVDISDKKNNELKIEQQATLLNSILNASINGVYACKAIRHANNKIIDFGFIQFNQRFLEIMDLKKEQANNNTLLSLFPKAETNGFLDQLIQVTETGKNLHGEMSYQYTSHNAWYNYSMVKLEDGVVVTFADITESKQTKQALKDSATYLQDVIDSSQTSIFLITPTFENGEITDFIYKTVNRSYAAYIGKEPVDLIGESHDEWFPGYKKNGLFELYKDAWTTGKEQRFESNYNYSNLDVWWDVMVKKRGDDLLITFHDISSLKQLQQEIERSATKLSTVVNTAQAGMFTLTPIYNEQDEIEDFRFGIVNEAVAVYIGETAAKLKGSLGSIYFPAYKTNGLFEIYKDTYLNNQPHQFDFHYEDGYDVYFNIQTVKTEDEILVTFTDQTVLKKLQRELEASVEDLKRSNESLKEFAYAASHDLQEPLRKIYFFSDRLSHRLRSHLTEEDQLLFSKMQNASTRMRTLIDDLLAYSQVSSKPKTLTTVDLNNIVNQVVVDVEASINEKGASISVAQLPIVTGEPLHLRLMFQNIISNALKYSKEDVTPVINISATITNKEFNGSSHKFNEITIADNGIGFSQADAQRIFHVFQRLHGHSEYSGTGVGLAIVQKVIENHKGFITAHGEPGKGATFTLYLPL